jgi:chromosome segregation ATPase
MLKKVSIVALGVFAAMCVLSYTKLGSYTCTAWHTIKKEAKEQVPVEFELKRLKGEVDKLEGDLKKHRGVAADKIEVARNLEQKIETATGELNQLKERMRKASADIDSGAERIVYNGREYPVDTVTRELRTDLQRAKNKDMEIKRMQDLLVTRKRSADLAEKQLGEIRDQRDLLIQRIAKLEADYEAVRLAQTESDHQFDDSRLAGIKQDLEELQKRINREKTELDLAQKYEGKVIVDDKPSTDDVNRDVKTFLNGDKADNKVTTETNRK